MEFRRPYNIETIFPFSLVEEVLHELKKNNAQFITYKQIPCKRIFYGRLQKLNAIIEFIGFKSGYSKNPVALLRSIVEFSQRAGLPFKLSKPAKYSNLTVLLQHDADRQPYKTIDMMEVERKNNVISSNYFFYERNMWDGDKEPYELDENKLKKLESEGFEIGYHLNAFELANYELKKAFELIERDIKWFEERFDLKTFVPHGGKKGPGGINNDHIPYSGILRRYNWVYNRIGIYKDASWSDGDVYFNRITDPRIIAKNASKGQRIMFLMHPQYYGDALMQNWQQLPVAKDDWWQRLWNL